MRSQLVQEAGPAIRGQGEHGGARQSAEDSLGQLRHPPAARAELASIIQPTSIQLINIQPTGIQPGSIPVQPANIQLIGIQPASIQPHDQDPWLFHGNHIEQRCALRWSAHFLELTYDLQVRRGGNYFQDDMA